MKILLTAINAKYIHSNLAVYSPVSYTHLSSSAASLFPMPLSPIISTPSP